MSEIGDHLRDEVHDRETVELEIDMAALNVHDSLTVALALVRSALAEGFPFPAGVDGEAHARNASASLSRALGEFR